MTKPVEQRHTPTDAPRERSNLELRRREQVLGAENARLTAQVELLSRTVAELHADIGANRNSRRAALNLMEDAIQSRGAEQRENTERRRVEEELREANRRKDEFLATLSHELRNPLAPMRNALAILAERSNDPVAADALEIMERQVGHLVHLVDDLLEVSRVTRGKFQLRREPVELSTIVRNALETSKPHLDDAQHRVEVVIANEPIVVDVDPVRLSQVVTNLLNNAAKYTPSQGLIQVSARREGDVAVVLVRDEGLGIPPDMLPKVFEIFTQVDHTLGRAQGGLGIGLALARTVVELHGGTIEARSAGIGRGSELEVRIPIHAAKSTAPRRTASRRPPSAVTGRTVLVVDDNIDAADTLAQVLEGAGAKVLIAYDGPSALEILRHEVPSIVILDVGMPGMDGCEVARRICDEHGEKRPKLVALTGWGQAADRQRTAAVGFDLHLVKPIDLAALHTALASL